jgi:AcrR family transcriptional regulator
VANQIPGVREKLIEAAIEEFLQKGFANASLREIAKAAGTSTNSIYVRFKDKSGLFAEIVTPVIKKVEQFYKKSVCTFEAEYRTASFDEMDQYTSSCLDKLVDVLYDNYAGCKLLVCCSDGTLFSDWLDMLAELESEYTVRYIDAIGSDAISAGRLTPELLHMLCSAYWAGIFEALRHDMKREDVKDYVSKVQRFFTCGWRDILTSQ